MHIFFVFNIHKQWIFVDSNLGKKILLFLFWTVHRFFSKIVGWIFQNSINWEWRFGMILFGRCVYKHLFLFQFFPFSFHYIIFFIYLSIYLFIYFSIYLFISLKIVLNNNKYHNMMSVEKIFEKAASFIETVKQPCYSRCKNYCLIHRIYFETSWCPDCSSSKLSLYS